MPELLGCPKCVRKLKYLGARGKSGCIPRASGTPKLGWGLFAAHGGASSGITQTGDFLCSLSLHTHKLVTTHEQWL